MVIPGSSPRAYNFLPASPCQIRGQNIMASLRTVPSPPPPPPRTSNPFDLYVTIVSAKHLKNVNWRNGGDLKPYAIFWVDPERRLATKPDESGSTKPVWNEQFTIPITFPLDESQLTIEIFHSKPSETPKPLVGTARVQLKDLLDNLDHYDYNVSGSTPRVHSLEIVRPSGRPQGKVKVKIGVRGRPLPPPTQQPSGYPDYNFAPQGGYYCSSAPPPPPPQRDYRDQYSSPGYSAPPPPGPPPPTASPYSYAPYSGYCSSYYSHPPTPSPQLQPPSRAFHHYSGVSGPSAPVDSSGYDDRASSVAGVTGSLGGLGLDERVKYEEEKRGERGESDAAAVRESYSDYRGKY